MKAKSILSSKTVWINAISGSAAICVIIANSDLVREHPKVISAFWLASAILGIILRLITNQPLAINPGKQ